MISREESSNLNNGDFEIKNNSDGFLKVEPIGNSLSLMVYKREEAMPVLRSNKSSVDDLRLGSVIYSRGYELIVFECQPIRIEVLAELRFKEQARLKKEYLLDMVYKIVYIFAILLCISLIGLTFILTLI